MAYYEGSMSSGAGGLKAILDEYLPDNQYWHIEDANAGDNIGVYHCDDSARNSDFIVVVKDNQADYANIEIWEAWDSENHQGVGCGLTNAGGNLLYVRKSSSYLLRVRDHHFVFINKNLAYGYYIGLPRRINDTQNIPIVIVNSGSAATDNPLGTGINNNIANYYVAWRFLDIDNAIVRILRPALNTSDSSEGSGYVPSFNCKSVDGKVRMIEYPVMNHTTRAYLGELEGVCIIGKADPGYSLANEQTVDVSGTIWKCWRGGTNSYGFVLELA